MDHPQKFTTFSPPGKPHIVCHGEYEQGSDQWLQARCGLLTASEVKLILTPTLKIASNEKERAHLYELLVQRVTRYVEPHFVTDDMMRGHEDEVEARIKYAEKFAEVDTSVAFMTNDKWGFTLGYSPDGLVGDDGAIECKSRRQKFQIQRIIEDAADPDHMFQLQTGLAVSERSYMDYVSYCGGLPMLTVTVHPDDVIQNAIVEAAGAFEERLAKRLDEYNDRLANNKRLIPTERRVELEMF